MFTELEFLVGKSCLTHQKLARKEEIIEEWERKGHHLRQLEEENQVGTWFLEKGVLMVMTS